MPTRLLNLNRWREERHCSSISSEATLLIAAALLGAISAPSDRRCLTAPRWFSRYASVLLIAMFLYRNILLLFFGSDPITRASGFRIAFFRSLGFLDDDVVFVSHGSRL